MHQGQALLALAGTYPSLMKMVIEAVANAIDAEATLVTVNINFKGRVILVRDNGTGRSKAEFEQALGSVSKSIKDTTKIGRFGRGLIAPLGKCDQFYFTSCPRDAKGNGYIEWKFVTSELCAMEKIEGIPHRQRTDLYFKDGDRPIGATNPVPWRTELRVENLYDDKVSATLGKIDIDELEDHLVSRFGPSLKQLNGKVQVEITARDGSHVTREIRAQEFAGRKIPPAEYKAGTGKVIFRLFHITPSTRTKGLIKKVQVGESKNPYRIDFKTFADHLEGFLDEDIVEALNSGVFSGEILGTHVQWAPQRTGFVDDENLSNFCIAIGDWYRQEGKKHVEEANNRTLQEKRQANALKSQLVIKPLIDEKFKDLLKSFTYGSIGKGHATEPAWSVDGNAGMSSAQPAPKKDEGTGHEETPDDEKKTRKSHKPATAAGPKGQERTYTKDRNQGLTLSPESLPGSSNPWELDVTHGKLILNTRHPFYFKCEEQSDATLQRYQEAVTVYALTHEQLRQINSLGEDATENQFVSFVALLDSQVFLILNADRLTGRAGGKKPKAKADAAKVEGQ
jgi:hypothetical protein